MIALSELYGAGKQLYIVVCKFFCARASHSGVNQSAFHILKNVNRRRMWSYWPSSGSTCFFDGVALRLICRSA